MQIVYRDCVLFTPGVINPLGDIVAVGFEYFKHPFDVVLSGVIVHYESLIFYAFET